MFLKKLLLILLIIQPLANKISTKLHLDYDIFNEMISIFVFAAYFLVIANSKKINNMIIVAIGYVLYMVLLAFLRDIYPLSFFQIIIYSQFFFYFFYFLTFSEEDKREIIISFKKLFNVFIVIIAFIAIYEVIDHSTFRQLLGVHSVKRGINYFYLISFFGSGPSLAIFISIYVVIWHYYHYALNIKIKKKHVFLLVLSVCIGLLSFSRKEVLFTLLFLLFFPYPSRSNLNKWAKRGIFIFGGALSLIVYYISFFGDANSVVFDQKYIRWKIITKSTQILVDYAPFGSGAGTFGSRVSLMMPDIYKKYNIGQDMLGWEALGNKGPIYDAFLFTFISEIGIGILIFFFFFYKLLEAKTVVKNEYATFSKNFLIIYLLALSLFVPMITNSFGFIIMIFVGLMISNVSILKYKRWYA